MAVATFSPVINKSGYIKKTGVLNPTYNVYTVVDGIVGRDVDGINSVEYRSFIQFNTSALPDDAIVTLVELIYEHETGSQTPDFPTSWRTQVKLGNWIGTSLTSADWNGGTLGGEIIWDAGPPYDSTWALDPEACALVSPTGNTDVALVDSSTYSGSGSFEAQVGIVPTQGYCQLRVTYDLPSTSAATATGKGLASGAGSVTRTGGASVLGKGIAVASGVVLRTTAAVAVAVGLVVASGEVTRLGGATSTGIGSAHAAGAVTRPAAGTATGRGLATGQAAALLAGQASATGGGAATSAGAVTREASASATGRALAIAAGTVEEVPGEELGAATATGHGYALAVASLLREPMALHMGTRAARQVSTGSVSAVPVHHASRRVIAASLATLNAAGAHQASRPAPHADDATRGRRRVT